MAKQKKSVQTYGYFQVQTWPLPELEQQAERWWRSNSRHYVQVAWITAASFTEAGTLTEQQSGAWYSNAGVKLLVPVPVRQSMSGDVLYLEDQWGKRFAWMRQAESWFPLTIPEDTPVQRYHSASPTKSVACSYDGKLVAVNDRDDLIRVYFATHRDCATYTLHRGDVRALAWSPDGSRIASGDWHNELHIWQVYGEVRHRAETARVLICLVEQPYCGEQITVIAWSPDGRYVATGSNHGYLRIWDATTGRCIWAQLCREQHAVRGIAWSPDRCFLLTGCADGCVQVWHVGAQQLWDLFSMDGVEKLSSLACSPDGSQLVVGDEGSQRLVLTCLSTKETSVIPLSTYGSQRGVLSVAFAPDGRLVVAGCADGSVQIVDQGEQQTIHIYHGHTGAVNAVAWSTDGSRIVSGGQDKLVNVWAVPQAWLTPEPSPLSGGQQDE